MSIFQTVADQTVVVRHLGFSTFRNFNGWQARVNIVTVLLTFAAACTIVQVVTNRDSFTYLLCSPYVIGQTIVIFATRFLSFSFPRVISTAVDWISTILPHMVCLSANLTCRSESCCTRLAGNAGRKKVTKNRHLGTIAQLFRATSSQLTHVLTIGKKLVKQWYVVHMSSQYG